MRRSGMAFLFLAVGLALAWPIALVPGADLMRASERAPGGLGPLRVFNWFGLLILVCQGPAFFVVVAGRLWSAGRLTAARSLLLVAWCIPWTLWIDQLSGLMTRPLGGLYRLGVKIPTIEPLLGGVDACTEAALIVSGVLTTVVLFWWTRSRPVLLCGIIGSVTLPVAYWWLPQLWEGLRALESVWSELIGSLWLLLVGVPLVRWKPAAPPWQCACGYDRRGTPTGVACPECGAR
jgi:hypothetical protein